MSQQSVQLTVVVPPRTRGYGVVVTSDAKVLATEVRDFHEFVTGLKRLVKNHNRVLEPFETGAALELIDDRAGHGEFTLVYRGGNQPDLLQRLATLMQVN